MATVLKRKHPITQKIFKVLLEKKFTGAYINKIYKEQDTIYANIHLPESKERSDLEAIANNLKEELCAISVKIGKQKGKDIEVLFGMKELGDEDNPILFSSSLLHEDTLKIELPSSYGKYILDFEDGASCHMLNGGATRMGKTTFIQYFATTLFLQMKGNIEMYISSVKIKDFYFFEGIPQVKLVETKMELDIALKNIIVEYQRRRQLLHTPELRKAKDAKDVKKHYPQYNQYFKPIFLIIDEFARFADEQNKATRKLVEEIVETAGYLNIHVIITSQRTDVVTVLTARIRANLLVRMAFHTADDNNRQVILGMENVPPQGKIPGRGILLDGDLNVVQIPFLDSNLADELLEEYRHEQSGERQNDSGDTTEIQGDEPESISMVDLPGELQSSKCSKPGIEAYEFEWVDTTGAKREG